MVLSGSGVPWVPGSRGLPVVCLHLTRKHSAPPISATIKEDDGEQRKTLLVDGARLTVGDSFKDARAVLLKGNYQEAWKRFDALIASHKAIQPTLNKVRFNAALCAIMAGDKDKAQQYFAAIHADPGAGIGPRDEGAFFAKIGARMSDDLGLRPFNKKDFDYQKDSEEVLGIWPTVWPTGTSAIPAPRSSGSKSSTTASASQGTRMDQLLQATDRALHE